MPLISVDLLDTCGETKLALWHITETTDSFFDNEISLVEVKDDFFKQYKSVYRQCEVLAVRAALRNIYGITAELSHDENGRPLLSNGSNVSISHTKGYAAVIVSQSCNVSVDIEYISPRVLKIVNMFMRTDENATSQTSALLHWCTKETLYKLYSADKLSFFEMRINAIIGDERQGIVVAENLRRKEILNVSYRITDDFVLTYVAIAR